MQDISTGQIAFITRLLAEKDTRGTKYEGHTTVPAGLTGGRHGSASQAINDLLTLPRRPQSEIAHAAPGYYVADTGEFVVVVENRAKTRTYAKTLLLTEHAQDDGSTRKHATWAYSAGLAGRVAHMEPMTMEEAAAFGHLHGICLICCRPLTDPKSVQRGIGPVCAEKVGVVALAG